MYLDGNGRVVVDDRYVCEFMAKSGTPEFFATCESLLRSVCLAAGHNLESKKSDVDELVDRLNIFKGELLESISHRKVDLSDVTKTIVSMNESNMARLDSIPRSLDELKSKIDMTKVVEDGLKRRDESLIHNVSGVQRTLDQMNSRMESMSATRSTNRYKGEEGETGLLSVLEHKLPLRDGYTVQEVKSTPHNCDLVVKRTGFPDVRIESKAHGRDTGECVRTAEVKRFETDLMALNNHGIFVSLYSGICGKGPLEIELLPTNKFAVYVSENNYDGDMLKELVNLVYKLDRFVTGPDVDGVTISTEAMMRVKSHFSDFGVKIGTLKANMKSSLAILNDMSFDMVEKILGGVIVAPPPPSQSQELHPCEWCKKECSKASALASHKKTCKSRPT
jgi:hypothetical protein